MYAGVPTTSKTCALKNVVAGIATKRVVDSTLSDPSHPVSPTNCTEHTRHRRVQSAGMLGWVVAVTRRDSDTSVEAARAAFEGRGWGEAYELLSRLDEARPLGADDLERLATCAYMIGRDDEYFSALERAYRAHVDTNVAKATRCAFWLGLCLLFAGKPSRANGWLSRARAHVDADPDLQVEAALLLIPQIEGHLGSRDWESAREVAEHAAEVGERLGDEDLRGCARLLHGRALIGARQIEAGLSVLDEVMLDAAGGALSPIMTGLVYCSVIEACHRVYAVERASEWTEALADWCEAQPQMIAFSGTCLVHRAEIMQLHGQWPDAIGEARRACDRYAKASLRPAGGAFYQQAEVYRLRGEYDAAESSYREASLSGYEPQPGLALLRLAQGNTDVACGAIRRLVRASEDPLQRARLLPACVEIMLAVGDLDAARSACRDLKDIAQRFPTEVLAAITAQAEAAVRAAEGDAQAALGLARDAFETWQRAGAPYEAARARILAGMACRTLGDEDGAQLELDAAATTLEQLGAAPELARVQGLATRPEARATHGLTPRELEVLRHVAMGKTNKTIAAELFVSEKTIDRHLSNIFNKLDVSSRTAAAAYAYEHKLT